MRSVLLEPSRMFHRAQAQKTSLGINFKFIIINIIKIKKQKSSTSTYDVSWDRAFSNCDTV